MSASIVRLNIPEKAWLPRSTPLLVGKDILELLSTSMYIDPITLYREYVQNAADAIDEARHLGLPTSGEGPSIEILIDATKRNVVIRDNGTGISGAEFEQRLSSFGASRKRGTQARGFRGVGRLAAVGSCQELIFRSRFAGEESGNEMRWDCRQVKSMLRTHDSLGLEDVINSCVQTRSVVAAHLGQHGFEVELRGILRHRNDCLLDSASVYGYLSQVAPAPFSPEFTFGNKIREVLGTALGPLELTIRVSGYTDPVYRPHRDSIVVPSGERITFSEVETVHIPASDGGEAATGWVLHHEYKGAIPVPQLRGLRLRSGNIQVGGSDLLQDHFQEPRFNSWAVGEVHTLDRRIVPNGRRDHFEANVHFENLVNHLSIVARSIGTRCRTSSSQRNWLRKFEQLRLRADETLDSLKQGAMGKEGSELANAKISCYFEEMRKVAAKESLPSNLRKQLERELDRFSVLASSTVRKRKLHNRLRKLSSVKRHVYENAFTLIYKHCEDRAYARQLVEAILTDL